MNTIIDGIVIFLLIQLLAFHIYLKIKGITTYEFITRHKIKPVSKSSIPGSISHTKPSTDDRFNLDQADLPFQNNESQRDRAPEEASIPRLTTPRQNSIGLTTFSKMKNESEIDLIKNDAEIQSQLRQDSNNNKENIVKPKPRRSGLEMKTPR